jgi:quinolinate synthase
VLPCGVDHGSRYQALARALSGRTDRDLCQCLGRVKAESDICCTSANAKKIIKALGVPRVIMLPDRYLARNTAAETSVEIIAWKGHCEVHERPNAADIRSLRASHPGITVLAHLA